VKREKEGLCVPRAVSEVAATARRGPYMTFQLRKSCAAQEVLNLVGEDKKVLYAE